MSCLIPGKDVIEELRHAARPLSPEPVAIKKPPKPATSDLSRYLHPLTSDQVATKKARSVSFNDPEGTKKDQLLEVQGEDLVRRNMRIASLEEELSDRNDIYELLKKRFDSSQEERRIAHRKIQEQEEEIKKLKELLIKKDEKIQALEQKVETSEDEDADKEDIEFAETIHAEQETDLDLPSYTEVLNVTGILEWSEAQYNVVKAITEGFRYSPGHTISYSSFIKCIERHMLKTKTISRSYLYRLLSSLLKYPVSGSYSKIRHFAPIV
jgi:hypothetical protein